MVTLEVNLDRISSNHKSFTCETLQKCASKFLDDYNEALPEITTIKWYEQGNDKEWGACGGNKSCVEALKRFNQGVLDE